MKVPVLQKRRYKNKDRTLVLGDQTLVMGILNVTPDSFSDGGQFINIHDAVNHAKKMVEDGVDIIDIGGESTRPQAKKVPESEELNRVIPIIEAVRREIPRIPISIDTYKPEVANCAMNAGADMINDIWSGQYDKLMFQVAAHYNCPYIMMHNRHQGTYTNLISDIKCDLIELTKAAQEANVSHENIIIDPGIGFAKSYTDNLHLMRHLDELTSLGFPVLLGTSRKTFIRETLNLGVDDVLEGSLATALLGIVQGCDIVRVHDVRATRRIVQMCDAIFN